MKAYTSHIHVRVLPDRPCMCAVGSHLRLRRDKGQTIICHLNNICTMLTSASHMPWLRQHHTCHEDISTTHVTLPSASHVLNTSVSITRAQHVRQHHTCLTRPSAWGTTQVSCARIIFSWRTCNLKKLFESLFEAGKMLFERSEPQLWAMITMVTGAALPCVGWKIDHFHFFSFDHIPVTKSVYFSMLDYVVVSGW